MRMGIGHCILASLSIWASPTFAIQAGQEIMPPHVRLTDDYFVNAATGQVSPTLETVSIGGELGLAHSISMYANHIQGHYGYSDKFSGKFKAVMMAENRVMKVDDDTCHPQLRVLRIYGPHGSGDFKAMKNGVLQCYWDGSLIGTSFEPLRDRSHILETINNGQGLRWTLGDGTQLIYGNYSSLSEIIYPNGFTIYIGSKQVTTNTGYQLAYIYETDLTKLPGDPGKGALPIYTKVPAENPGFWASANPMQIKAINNAIDYCDPNKDTYCTNLEHTWPTVQFIWPAGMPRAIYIGESVFKVIGPEGGVTEYHYQAHDLALVGENDLLLAGWNSNNNVAQFRRKGEFISPRLVGIKPANSQTLAYSYTYKNDFDLKQQHSGASGTGLTGIYSWWELKEDAGVLVRATGHLGRASYSIGVQSSQGPNPLNTLSVAGTRIEAISSFDYPGTLTKVSILGEGSYLYNNGNYTDWLSWVVPAGDSERTYFNDRDSRGNVKSVTRKGKTLRSANYPSTCQDRKTCNKPLWTKDAKGFKTDYTYHHESGQLLSVTKPSDAHNIRPQVRYNYEPRYARYKRSASGGPVVAERPIWLLTRESYCRQGPAEPGHTNASPAGCVNPNDEVVTTYDYGDDSTANNLQLRSVTVAADGQSRRTCYRYDIYGNRIGETQPKGADVCPQ